LIAQRNGREKCQSLFSVSPEEKTFWYSHVVKNNKKILFSSEIKAMY